MITFKTATGSVYQIDTPNKRIRRLYGSHSPTQRQGKDGEWKTFVRVGNLQINRPCMITWRTLPAEGGYVLEQATWTTVVVEINRETEAPNGN